MIPIKIMASFIVAYIIYEVYQVVKTSLHRKILRTLRLTMTKCMLLMRVYDYMKMSEYLDKNTPDRIRVDFIGLAGLEYTRQAKELSDALENETFSSAPTMSALSVYMEKAESLNYITTKALSLLFENNMLSMECFISDFENLNKSNMGSSQLTAEIWSLFKKHKEGVTYGQEK